MTRRPKPPTFDPVGTMDMFAVLTDTLAFMHVAPEPVAEVTAEDDEDFLGPEPDVVRAIRMLTALGGDAHEVRCLVIEGEPPSKYRPKFGRGHAYMPAAAKADERRTGTYLKRWFKQPMQGNAAMACIFVRPNRQRIDVDNMLKHVCDAANGILWVDDHQVTGVLGVSEMDPSRPRTVIAVSEHKSTLLRGVNDVTICAVCNLPFPRLPSTTRNLTCSPTCAAHYRKVKRNAVRAEGKQ